MAFLSSIITPTNLITANTALTLTNKTLTAPVINSPTGIVKGDVGLGNVDNTSDATKNSATATLTNKTIDYANNTLTNVVGVTATQTLTNKTLTLPIIDNPKLGYTTTATAAGTTTLTVSSNHQQFFTGVTTQTIVMPDVTTLTLGMSYSIENLSTGTLTVQSSGANTINTIPPGLTALCTCNSITGTTDASWDFDYHAFSTITGTGSNVLATSPTLVTPALGTPSSGTLSSCTVDGTNKVGFLNIPQVGSAKVASYTLVVGDVGKFVVLSTSGTVVIPASIFAVGDAISIFNDTAASIACTCSAITTVYKGGTNTNISATGFSVTTRGVCTILFVTATTVVITGNLA